MLNYEFPPIGGGAATANYHLALELAELDGITADIVTSSRGGYREENFADDVTVYRLDVSKEDVHYWRSSEIGRWTVKAYRKTAELVRRNDYDVSHCWFGWPSGVIGYRFRNRVPYLVGLRGSDIPGYNSRLAVLDRILFRHLSKVVWRNAEEVTVLSEDSAKLAGDTLERDFRLIRNGVDTDSFRPDFSTREDDEIKVLFVGRLIERKGVDRLLDAFSSLQEGPDGDRLTLSIVGSGNLDEKLERRAVSEGMIDDVEFFGSVPHEDLPAIYRNHDLFVLPSLNEAMSNVVPEAMASGLPIVTTQTGPAELLDGNGLALEEPRPSMIEAGIRHYLTNPSLLLRHGKRSRELATDLSWRRTAEKYADLYERIASNGAT